MKRDALHDRLLAFVTALPGAFEDRPWGSVHCKVDGKIFVGWGRHDDGAMSLGFKTDKELQALLLASDPRFSMAKYVGKHGWVDMRIPDAPDWPELEHFIRESYRLVAPKKRLKELDATPAAKRSLAKNPVTKSPAAKKAVAKAAPASKPIVTKAVAKKPAPRKAAKTAGTKQAVARRPAPKKAVAKTAGTKKAVAQKPAPRKAAKTAGTKTAVAKKPAPKPGKASKRAR